MKMGTALGAAALAGLMALSMTACGTASTNTTPNARHSYQDGEIYDGTRTYDAGTLPNASRNARQDMKDALQDNRRTAKNIGDDVKHAGQDAAGTIKRAYEQALENGRVENHTSARRNTGSGAGATYGNGASGSTQNTTNAGVSLSGIQ